MQYYEKKISRTLRECKALGVPFEVKQIAADGSFAGYASVFDVVDSQRDVVISGAFAESLMGRREEVKLLWQHHMDEPIGTITSIFEDPQGLYVEGRLSLESPRGKEAYSMLKEGVVKGMSIGYSPVRYRFDPDKGVRRLEKVDLWEVSLVTFPANDQAQVTVFKGMDAAALEYANRDSAVESRDDVVRMHGPHFNWKQAAQGGQVMRLQGAIEQAMGALN